MPRSKDTRKIIQGIQVPDPSQVVKSVTRSNPEGKEQMVAFKTFLPGREDELEMYLTPKMLDRLLKQGAIEGDWEPEGKDDEEPSKAAERIAKSTEKLEELREKEAKAKAEQEAKTLRGGKKAQEEDEEPEKKPTHSHPQHPGKR